MAEETQQAEVIEVPEGSPPSVPPAGANTTSNKEPGTEATEAPPRTFKVKIEGKELEVPEDELVKGYQIEQVSRKRLSDAAEIHKSTKAVLDLLDKDFKGAFVQRMTHKLGSKEEATKALRDFAVGIVKEMIDEEQLTPEDRQAMKRKGDFEERESSLKAREAALQQKQMDEEAGKQSQQLEADLNQALEKGGLPATDAVRAQMLQTWLWADENGVDMTWEQVSKEVKKMRRTGATELSKTLKDEEFEELFSPRLEAWHKKKIDALRNGSTSQTSTRKGEAAPTAQRRSPKKPSDFNSMAEWSRWKDEQLSQS